MHGHLDLLTLKLIENEPLSGYSLLKRINERTGWKPSTGSLYPLLESMRKNGEVTVKPDGRRRIYSITSLGKNKLKNIASHRDDLVDEMMTRINSVCAATSMKTMPDMVNLMVKHKMVIGKYELEINEMRREFMLAVSEGVPPKEIKAAIAEATRRIRSARK